MFTVTTIRLWSHTIYINPTKFKLRVCLDVDVIYNFGQSADNNFNHVYTVNLELLAFYSKQSCAEEVLGRL